MKPAKAAKPMTVERRPSKPSNPVRASCPLAQCPLVQSGHELPAKNHIRRNARNRCAPCADLLPRPQMQPPHRGQRRPLAGTVVKKRPQSQDGPRSMSNQTPLRVFFSCLSCEAVYYATQKRKPSIIGRFACERCKTTVHRWWSSQYSFTDWTGPLDKNRLRAATSSCTRGSQS